MKKNYRNNKIVLFKQKLKRKPVQKFFEKKIPSNCFSRGTFSPWKTRDRINFKKMLFHRSRVRAYRVPVLIGLSLSL